jgi:hypothetical protein
MAMQLQENIVGELDDGTGFAFTKGQVLPDSHELVKRDAAASGMLFKPLNVDGDEPPKTRGGRKAAS